MTQIQLILPLCWHLGILLVFSLSKILHFVPRGPQKRTKNLIFQAMFNFKQKTSDTQHFTDVCNKDVTVSLNRKTKQGKLGIRRQNKGLVKKPGRLIAFPVSLIHVPWFMVKTTKNLILPILWDHSYHLINVTNSPSFICWLRKAHLKGKGFYAIKNSIFYSVWWILGFSTNLF